MNKVSVREFLLDLFFPKFCLFCQKEGDYLCQDCFSLLDVTEENFCLCQNPLRLPGAGKCKKCKRKNLSGLYSALSYQHPFSQKLIQKFKYENPVKELSKPLASSIISHFQLSGKMPEGEILIPIPLAKKRLKFRGFNQAEEIGKELSHFLSIPLVSDCLIKIKETLPQVELPEEERIENIKGVFAVKNEEKILGKRILLVDDVYTTGATLEEAARVLREVGAKEIWGVVLARG